MQNVWRHWVEDTQDDIYKSFSADRNSSEDFCVRKVTRDPEDAERCLAVLLESFEIIHTYYKELQSLSDRYPYISWERVWELVGDINKNSRVVTAKGRLPRNQTELCFTRAAKSDAARGPPNALQRSDLWELVLRMGYAWSSAVYSPKEKLGGRLREFIGVFLRPFYDEGPAMTHRRTIRDSKHLNKLLYDNLRALEVLYERVKYF